MTDDDVEELDWDLSWLLDRPAPPPDGPARAVRTARRARVTRIAGMAAAIVLVAGGITAAVMSRVSSPTRVVTAPVPATAAPLVPGPPASAVVGASPFDWGPIRVWLPHGWSPGYGEACNQPMAGDTVDDNGFQGDIALQPCSPVADYLIIETSNEDRGQTGTPSGTETVNGLAVHLYSIPATQLAQAKTVADIPALHVSVSAQGAAAVPLLSTLQLSAAYLLATRTTAQPAPTGWRRVVYDGLALAVPSTWEVDDPSDVCNPPDPSLQLGDPTSLPSCPLATYSASDAPFPLANRVSVTAARGNESVQGSATRTYHEGQLTITASISAARPPAISLLVTGGPMPLDVSIDVGADPTIAQDVLASIGPAAGGSL